MKNVNYKYVSFVIVAIIMLLALSGTSLTTYAAASNESANTAATLSMDVKYNISFNSRLEDKYYKISIPQKGNYRVCIYSTYDNDSSRDFWVGVFRSAADAQNMNNVLYSESGMVNINNSEPDYEVYSLQKKTYYIRVQGLTDGRYNTGIKIRKEYKTNTSIYNLGDETYHFENYSDADSTGGHCFGMSMTSSGFFKGLLDRTRVIGGYESSALYSYDKTSLVKKPICYYQKIQGSFSAHAMVAGGSHYLHDPDEEYYDINSDWNEVVNYVKNHNYDNTGSLQVAFRTRKRGGHATNFLYYKEVNGQQRIYIYDNNFPKVESYLYRNSDGKVYEGPSGSFSGSLDCVVLRDVSRYFKKAGGYNPSRVIYAQILEVNVQGNVNASPMDCDLDGAEHLMYEIPEGVESVVVEPTTNESTFTYMDEEYSFGKVDENTYGTLYLDNDEGEDVRLLVTNGEGETTVVYGKPLPSHEHEWDTSYTVDKLATCTSKGSRSIHCVDCDVIREGSSRSIPKLAHSGKWKTIKKATELGAGKKTRTCVVCGHVDKASIPALKPTLKTVAISKPKAAKKSAVIKWKKVSKKNLKKFKKVEIQYSTNKNFKKNVKSKYASAKKTSYKLKKLKSKKKYYVRIRAYTKSGGAVHVSKWSAKKSIKVK